MPKTRIPIAGDHASPALKAKLISLLPEYDWEDLGTHSSVESVDYPDYASLVARRVSSGSVSRGILICGSGIGVCIAANKFPGVRASMVESTEAAKLSREHNDANILCLGARLLTEEKALEITRVWLETPFSNGPRHSTRIEKIKKLETEIKSEFEKRKP
ncbi:MAG: ribose 5-phosphate isomerase B [Cryobacterium sp.]|nr:ribose 5-phosphate isomerase B [Oligoflexia bacterium]